MRTIRGMMMGVCAAVCASKLSREPKHENSRREFPKDKHFGFISLLCFSFMRRRKCIEYSFSRRWRWRRRHNWKFNFNFNFPFAHSQHYFHNFHIFVSISQFEFVAENKMLKGNLRKLYIEANNDWIILKGQLSWHHRLIIPDICRFDDGERDANISSGKKTTRIVKN